MRTLKSLIGEVKLYQDSEMVGAKQAQYYGRHGVLLSPAMVQLLDSPEDREMTLRSIKVSHPVPRGGLVAIGKEVQL